MPYTITEACNGCMKCLRDFNCIAIFEEEGFAHIDPELCNGCGVCADVCTEGVIVQERTAGETIQEISRGDS